MTTYGLLTTRDREALTNTATTIALLPVTGAADLATKLRCVAQTARPTRDLLVGTAALGTHVRLMLLTDASPDRWLDTVGNMTHEEGSLIHELGLRELSLVGDIVAERQSQAAQVATAVALCEKVMDRAPIHA